MDNPRPVRSLLYVLFGVCPLLFFTDLTRNPYYTQITLLNILIPACWVIWLIIAIRQEELVWVSSPLDAPILALVAMCLLSWIHSLAVHPAFAPSIYSEGSRSMVFLVVNTALVYAAALRARETSLVNRLLWISYGVGAIAAAYGVAQYFGIELIWPRQLSPYGNRPVSTFGNPNFMSSYLVVLMPVLVADFLFGVTGFPRVLLFAIIQLTAAAMLATMTRSSWAGLAVGLLFVAWGMRQAEKKTWPRAWPLLGVMGLLTILWPQSAEHYRPAVIDRLIEVKRATTETYGSVYQRFLIWIAAWGMVQDHPFVGKGYGCFELFYPFYQGPLLFVKSLMARTHANNAHNEILEYWSQIGSIGVGLVAWLWVVFFRVGQSVTRRLSNGWNMLGWGVMGGVAGMLVDNLLNVSIHFAVPALLLWWWVGMMMALDPANLKITRIPLLPLWRKGVLAIGVVGLSLLAARAGAMWAGETNFFKGFKLSKGGVDLMSAARYLERAYAWHPLEVNNNYELGNVYARLGNRDRALFMYQRALDANAGYDEIYFNRATLLMQSGRFDEAVHYYELCLAINPLSQTAYNALGGLYFKDLPRYSAAAEKLYLQGARVFSQDKDMWNNLGYYYTQVGNWVKAKEGYEKALALDPTFELAAKNRAVVEARIKAESRSSKR